MPRQKKVPSGMPVVPEAQGSEREALALWFKSRLEEHDRQYREEKEMWRTHGVHPSPIFQDIVRNLGSLVIPKKLVAKMLGMTVADLQGYYKDDYDIGMAHTIRDVSINAVRIATSTTDPNAGRLAMQILERVARENWLPPAQKVITQEEKSPENKFDASRFSREERAQLDAMITRVNSGGAGDPIEPQDAPIIE